MRILIHSLAQGQDRSPKRMGKNGKGRDGEANGMEWEKMGKGWTGMGWDGTGRDWSGRNGAARELGWLDLNWSNPKTPIGAAKSENSKRACVSKFLYKTHIKAQAET